jgi:hypothetical protein
MRIRAAFWFGETVIINNQTCIQLRCETYGKHDQDVFGWFSGILGDPGE